MATDMRIWRTTHPLDSEWEFIDVRRGEACGLHAGDFTLSIAEALIMWRSLGEQLTAYERENHCLTCGRAPYMFVGGDCPVCNPPVKPAVFNDVFPFKAAMEQAAWLAGYGDRTLNEILVIFSRDDAEDTDWRKAEQRHG
jgi:hypothetical protein